MAGVSTMLTLTISPSSFFQRTAVFLAWIVMRNPARIRQVHPRSVSAIRRPMAPAWFNSASTKVVLP